MTGRLDGTVALAARRRATVDELLVRPTAQER